MTVVATKVNTAIQPKGPIDPCIANEGEATQEASGETTHAQQLRGPVA